MWAKFQVFRIIISKDIQYFLGPVFLEHPDSARAVVMVGFIQCTPPTHTQTHLVDNIYFKILKSLWTLLIIIAINIKLHKLKYGMYRPGWCKAIKNSQLSSQNQGCLKCVIAILNLLFKVAYFINPLINDHENYMDYLTSCWHYLCQI